MQRVQSHRQFNNSVEKRVRKDELIDRIAQLFKANGINFQSIRACDPSIKPFEITYLFGNNIDRLGIEWTAFILVMSNNQVRKFVAFYALLAAITLLVVPSWHVAPGSYAMISLVLYALWEAGRWLNAWALRQQVKQ